MRPIRILTVTLNPALDINYQIKHFKTNETNRVDDISKTAGGKGLNVTRVLKTLKQDVTATGILGGAIGQLIKTKLNYEQINHQFIYTKEDTRFCIAIIHDQNQTEILESSPTLSEDIQQQFLSHFRRMVVKYDYITLSGSLPATFPIDYYVQLLSIAHSYNKPVILDTSGETLTYTVKHSINCPPLLIKPNETEITAISNNANLNDVLLDDALSHIPNILVTQGKNGALLRTENQLYQYEIPAITAVNPVGSGDSTVAGICEGLTKYTDIKNAVVHGLAAGTANALTAKTGHIDYENFQILCNEITFKKVE